MGTTSHVSMAEIEAAKTHRMNQAWYRIAYCTKDIYIFFFIGSKATYSCLEIDRFSRNLGLSEP